MLVLTGVKNATIWVGFGFLVVIIVHHVASISISQVRKKKKKNDLEHKNIGRNFKKTMGQIETYHSIQSVTEM